jgi:hypothetical protein
LIPNVLDVLSDLRRDLVIRHPINSLYTHDASTEVGSIEPIAQFALGLTRAEDQHGFGMTNRRNDRTVVNVEMGFRILCRLSRAVLGLCHGLLQR